MPMVRFPECFYIWTPPFLNAFAGINVFCCAQIKRKYKKKNINELASLVLYCNTEDVFFCQFNIELDQRCFYTAGHKWKRKKKPVLYLQYGPELTVNKKYSWSSITVANCTFISFSNKSRNSFANEIVLCITWLTCSTIRTRTALASWFWKDRQDVIFIIDMLVQVLNGGYCDMA